MDIDESMNKRRLKKILCVTLSVVICIFLIGVLYLFGTTRKLNEKVESQAKIIKPVDSKRALPINILILGVDIGDPNIKDNDDIKRTDSMMLLHYNPSEKDVKVISIPRDTKIKINNKDIKINSAYAFGGAKKTIEVVENMLDTTINYYIKVDYKAFTKFIDAIGGVNMDIEEDMKYDDEGQDLHIDFKKGKNIHLDGKKAEEFFRWRKNNDGTGLAEGDLGRIKNQHIFMEKVTKKIKSPMMPLRIPKILSVIEENVETNMSPRIMVKHGSKGIGLSSSNIKFSTLEGEPKYIKGISYFVYDKNKNKDTLQSLQSVSKTASSSTIGGVDKSKLKVKVLNGTNTEGLAKIYSSMLKNLGYQNIIIGNGEKLMESKAYIKDNNKDLKSIIKQDFNIKKLQSMEEKQGDFDIIIILGEDKKTLKN
ncbi:LCP family protein [Clostridium algidicarnis]|uniref:LytR family transcriptional attenuator n=1 Tax=Clostridium algidicarnis DSM 15099 TaxID=1121295 RepID=A0A2S6FWM9_9CLOT|nr:LCP family protein [Clostridium algidicarnis]MBB6630631.1 LCP family protein [Clostridium algidicarnis]MBB6697462.1 LCP family protein [Clostridium algidicarnis]PPK47947.1 LytR family transcriptional attenuator [Clostridium algidicarnis DSM 15099]